MSGLFDIAPLSEKVKVNGKWAEVRGVTLIEGVQLITRFPQLATLFAGGADAISAADLVQLGGEVLGALIAAGVGAAGDHAAEAGAARLPAATQLALILPILRFTLPEGAGPFVANLTALAGVINPDGAAAPATAGKGMRVRAKR